MAGGIVYMRGGGKSPPRGASSVLGVYNLRVYGSIRKQGIKSLLELSHHAVNQVLIAGSLSVRIRIDQCGEFLLIHRWGLRR